MLPALEDAVCRLLKPGGRTIPAAGAAMVALAEWSGLEQARLGDICGFDLSPFNRFEGSPYRLDGEDPRLSLVSEAAPLLSFDFASGGPWRGGSGSVPLEAAAPANGVVQWVRLQLDVEGFYENRPGPARSAWAVLFTPLHPLRRVPAGHQVRISGSWEPTRLRVWADA